MPSTRIATGEWITGRELDMIEAAQAARVDCLQLPDWDREIVRDTYPRIAGSPQPAGTSAPPASRSRSSQGGRWRRSVHSTGRSWSASRRSACPGTR